MNLITHTVVEVLGAPEEVEVGGRIIYRVPVKADSWGSVRETHVHCYSKREADSIKVGYKWEG